MDVKIFDKMWPPSRDVTRGLERAPHRCDDYAMGLIEDLFNQPLVGVVSRWNDGRGTPCEFCTIIVSDDIAVGQQGTKSSQVSREVIADSIEVTMRTHCCDAMAGIAACDKSLRGTTMAGVRLNVPSIFMYGSSILPSKGKGRDVTVADVLEAVGQQPAGNMPKGEMISIDAEDGRLGQDDPARELAKRRAECRPRQTNDRSGAVWKYAQQVGSARVGAVTHQGAKSEVIVYADQ